MITLINTLPMHVIGFSFSGVVTKEDYDAIVFPAVEQLVKANADINMLIEMNTAIKNMTGGAWLDDALLGLKHITQWRKVAIISDEKFADQSAKVMDALVPGKYKAFRHLEKDQAIEWVSA